MRHRSCCSTPRYNQRQWRVGWIKVGSSTKVAGKQTIPLNTGGATYRYYLVWINNLGNHNQVAVNEIALYK